MVSWALVYTKQAQKDAKKLSALGLRANAERLLSVLTVNPLQNPLQIQNPPPYEVLVGNLKGALSRRINIQHRLVYQILQDEHIVKILRMWTHYE